jgi:hypothetical protein
VGATGTAGAGEGKAARYQQKKTDTALLELDAIRYDIDLIKIEIQGLQTNNHKPLDRWEEIKAELREARKHDTGEFKNPLALLLDRLDQHFGLDDLGQLAFGLNIDLEKVSSVDANKIDIIVDIITHFQRRERLDILIKAADQARPNIEQPFSEFVGVV